jgi:hypothetical protein
MNDFKADAREIIRMVSSVCSNEYGMDELERKIGEYVKSVVAREQKNAYDAIAEAIRKMQGITKQ